MEAAGIPPTSPNAPCDDALDGVDADGHVDAALERACTPLAARSTTRGRAPVPAAGGARARSGARSLARRRPAGEPPRPVAPEARLYNSEMTPNEIRASFLAYFKEQGHRVVASAPLVPHDDPTLLFTNAGMNQFKDVLLGRETRDYRARRRRRSACGSAASTTTSTTSGPSFRHHTFFEMLGNFSFGDYFKTDAIELAWTLLTREWGIPKDRLYVTVFQGDAAVPRDDEAFDLWRSRLPAAQIGELGADDNFWTMGDTGPCGRCSEIYYFRGAHLPCAAEAPAGAAAAWSATATASSRSGTTCSWSSTARRDGTLPPLPAQSIDTGMGLERVSAVLQGKLSNYETDLFIPILTALGALPGPRIAARWSRPTCRCAWWRTTCGR